MTEIEESVIDHDTGNKVKTIIQKYMFEPISEETCDLVMEDVRAVFGEDISAQVMMDTDTNDIEITVRDKNGRYLRCSALELKSPA
jgi:hypothetical protein